MGLQTVRHDSALIPKPPLCHPEEQTAQRKNPATKIGEEVSFFRLQVTLFECFYLGGELSRSGREESQLPRPG